MLPITGRADEHRGILVDGRPILALVLPNRQRPRRLERGEHRVQIAGKLFAASCVTTAVAGALLRPKCEVADMAGAGHGGARGLGGAGGDDFVGFGEGDGGGSEEGEDSCDESGLHF